MTSVLGGASDGAPEDGGVAGSGAASAAAGGPWGVNGVGVAEAAHWYLDHGLMPIPWVAVEGRKVVCYAGFSYAGYRTTHAEIDLWGERRSGTWDISSAGRGAAGEWQVGLALSEAGGVFCVDVDSAGELEEWSREWGLDAAEPTWRASTGRVGGGGEHYLYRWPEGAGEWPRAGAFGAAWPHLEIKSNGFVAVAPSVHPSGARYAWASNGAVEVGAPGYLLTTFLQGRAGVRAAERSGGRNGSSGSGSGSAGGVGGGGGGRPDLDALLSGGVPAGWGHDDTLRDVVWYGVLEGRGDLELWLLWSAIVARTVPLVEGWVFDRGDFERHLRGARELLGVGEGLVLEEWMIGTAKALAANGSAPGVGAPPPVNPAPAPANKIRITWASEFDMKPIRWLWHQRIQLGTFAIMTGAPGVGKSTLLYHVASAITRGELEGRCFGTPRRVLVCASEGSWDDMITPCLTAHGADLGMVGRIEAWEPGDPESGLEAYERGLILPKDLGDMQARIVEHDVALVILDPLMSLLDGTKVKDGNNDANTRRALDPLAKMADVTGCAMWAIVHSNKNTSANALGRVMGSTAFVAVARSVHYVIEDRADPETRLFGATKNNAAPAGLATLRFHLEPVAVGALRADGTRGAVSEASRVGFDGEVINGMRVCWDGEDERSINDVLEEASEGVGRGVGGGRPHQGVNAEEWLTQYLTARVLSGAGEWVRKSEVVAAAAEAGIGERTLGRVEAERIRRGWPAVSWWARAGTPEETFVETEE